MIKFHKINIIKFNLIFFYNYFITNIDYLNIIYILLFTNFYLNLCLVFIIINFKI